MMSLFGPALLIVPILLVVLSARAWTGRGANDVVGLIGMLLVVAVAATMRVYFAVWYVRDKGRNGAWGIAGGLGFLGWVLLWLLADRNKSNTEESRLPEAQPGPIGVHGDNGVPLASEVLFAGAGPPERQALQALRMKARAVLRMLVFADVALLMSAVAAEFMFEGTLPEPVRSYAENQELPTALLIAGALLLLLLIVSWVALCRFWSRAHLLYAATWLSLIVIGPFGGPHIATGVGEAFSALSSSATGAILALTFLTPLREEFSRSPPPTSR